MVDHDQKFEEALHYLLGFLKLVITLLAGGIVAAFSLFAFIKTGDQASEYAARIVESIPVMFNGLGACLVSWMLIIAYKFFMAIDPGPRKHNEIFFVVVFIIALLIQLTAITYAHGYMSSLLENSNLRGR